MAECHVFKNHQEAPEFISECSSAWVKLKPRIILTICKVDLVGQEHYTYFDKVKKNRYEIQLLDFLTFSKVEIQKTHYSGLVLAAEANDVDFFILLNPSSHN